MLCDWDRAHPEEVPTLLKEDGVETVQTTTGVLPKDVADRWMSSPTMGGQPGLAKRLCTCPDTDTGMVNPLCPVHIDQSTDVISDVDADAPNYPVAEDYELGGEPDHHPTIKSVIPPRPGRPIKDNPQA